MPYYMGDYMGDYYAGDPGIFGRLGSFFRKQLTARGAVTGALSVIPGGGALSRVIGPRAAGVLSRAASMGKMVVKSHPAGTAVAGVVASAGALAAVRHRAAPAGAGMAMGVGAPPGRFQEMLGMRGFHVSRRTGNVVRNRRMRVTNPRALRRAIRRAQGFARLARKVMHFVSPRAPRGRPVFRAKRRTKRV